MQQIKQLKVVHIITSLDMGGAERMLSNVVLGMDRNKFQNIVISLRGLGHWGPILQQNGITVYALNMDPTPASLLKIIQLWKLLRNLRPDFVQGWMYHANVMALLIGKLAGVKNIAWNIRCSLMDLSQYRFTTKLVFKSGAWLARFPTVIMNNSRDSIQQHTDSGYKSNRWLYIPNGFDTQKFQPNAKVYREFRQQHNLSRTAKLFALIARYDPMKDHATFINAAGILAQEYDDVYFVMAGKNINSSNTELLRLIERNKLEERVLLLDQVNDVHELLPAIDYLTQTSVFGEGFPNVVAEAMACGVECFVTDVGESLDIIGTTGYAIPKQDPEELAKIWFEALSSDEMSKAKRKLHARQRVNERYSMTSILEMYEKCYRK